MRLRPWVGVISALSDGLYGSTRIAVGVGCRAAASCGRRNSGSRPPSLCASAAAHETTRSPAGRGGKCQPAVGRPLSVSDEIELEAKLAQLQTAKQSQLSRSVSSALADVVRGDKVWDRRVTGSEYRAFFAEIAGAVGAQQGHAESALMHCLSGCQMYERALTLMDYMRSKDSVTMIALAYLASVSSRELTREREQVVFDCFDRIQQLGALDQMDSLTSSLVLEAMARTSRWRSLLPLVSSMAEGSASKAALSPEVCKQLAFSAVRSGCMEDACHLLALIYGHGQNTSVFAASLRDVLHGCKQSADSVTMLFETLRNFDGLLLPSDLKGHLQTSCPPTWNVSAATINSASGKCSCCGQELERCEMSAADLERLRETFVEASIIGGNAFLRSSPAEISSFKQHMQANSSNGGPYDIVIDGLNVAAKRYPGRTSTDRIPPKNGKEFPFHRTQLAIILDYFHAKKKKILVVGKPPIAALLSDQWKRRIDYFVVNSTSQDDLFVVYAALLSGPQCYIVSEDQYKDHKKHLPPDAKKLFVSWQGWRQINFVRLENDKQPVFKMPAPYHGNAQRSLRGWHLPLEDRQEALLTYNVTTKWLCIDMGCTASDSAPLSARAANGCY